MADKPETKTWKAFEDRQPGPGRRPTLRVSGKVKITNTNQKPRLAEASPQGINPTILLLDLFIDTEGAGIEPPDPWADATFGKQVTPHQYKLVEIRWEGQLLSSCVVQEIQ